MDPTEKLSITVTAQQAQRIREDVASGAYASASEVIRAGLRALERDREEYQKRIESIRAKVEASLNDPRPHLTGEEVRERLRLHHEETVKARRRRARMEVKAQRAGLFRSPGNLRIYPGDIWAGIYSCCLRRTHRRAVRSNWRLPFQRQGSLGDSS